MLLAGLSLIFQVIFMKRGTVCLKPLLQISSVKGIRLRKRVIVDYHTSIKS